MITIRNVKLNVIVEGNGEAIVLLHGWGQNFYMMKFLQDHLASKYNVVNMDLAGFGESEEPREVWNIEDYADVLHEVLETLHIEKPILIAHSFGARIALRYALKFPVQKMILTGAAGIKDRHGIAYYLRVYLYKVCKKLHMTVHMGSEDYQKASPIMKGVLVASVQDNLQYILKDIDCETLLVWGEKDTQTPLWMGKIMEKELQNATLVILPKEDHFAYFHQSLQFKGIVDAFLHG